MPRLKLEATGIWVYSDGSGVCGQNISKFCHATAFVLRVGMKQLQDNPFQNALHLLLSLTGGYVQGELFAHLFKNIRIHTVQKCNSCCAENLISVFAVVHQKLTIMLTCDCLFLLRGATKTVVGLKCWQLKQLFVGQLSKGKLPTSSSKWTQMVSACRVGMP